MRTLTLTFRMLDRVIVGSPVGAHINNNIDDVLGKLLGEGGTIVASGGAGAGGGEFKPSNLRGWENYLGYIIVAFAPRSS
jgi:hypothetical protein